MRRWIGLAVLAGALASLGWVLKAQFGGQTRLGGVASRIESRWQTEEQWLVESIARDLAEMAEFGRSREPRLKDVDVTVATPPGGGLPLAVSVSLGAKRRVDQQIGLATFVWAPEEYVGLARQLLDTVGVREAPPSPDTSGRLDLADSLSDLRAETIERANQQVSSALGARFTDPAQHEAAAFVLSAFAFREAAGMFADTRATLCRITAHLAFAGALRQGTPVTTEGRLARAVLLVLAGRGADATAALDVLDQEAPAVQGWRRALRRRLFEDTRADTEPKSLLERRELYRALLLTVDSGGALEHARRLGSERVTDWWRLAAEAEVGPSVETGNVLLADAVEREMDEARQVWRLAKGSLAQDAELIASLNLPAERCLGAQGPRVIGWGTWAAFLQRHLVLALWSVDWHVREMLGLHQSADSQLVETNRRFGRLTLYPILEVRFEQEARRRPKRFDEVVDLAVQQPQLLNAFQWWSLGDASRYEVIRRGMPEPKTWFAPGVPRGTTFDADFRRRASLLPQDAAGLEAFRNISPQDFHVVASALDIQFRNKPPLPEVERLLASRAQYDMRVLDRLSEAAARDAAALQPLLARKCELMPGHCFPYADLLVELGDDAQAARAYRRGSDLAADRVLAAANSRWLVNHYLDKGEKAQARALATAAADTGSAAGMLTLSRFLERTGDYDGAEALLRQEIERYGNQPQNPDEREESQDGSQRDDQLIAFYHRMAHKKAKPGYEQRFVEMTKEAFPSGLERLDPSQLSGYPTDGIFILKTWPEAERRGLKTGDIIVGLDGYRVRTRRQYALILGFSDDPQMSLLVFRHPRYMELKPRAPWRHLGVDMRSHKPAGG